MKSIQYFCISILLVSFNLSHSQNSKINEGHKKFEKFAYVEAREIYLKIVQNGYRSIDLLQKIGDCYYLDGELENAVEWYAELTTKYADYDDEYLFRYSQSLKSLKLYKESDRILKKYYYNKGLDFGSKFDKPAKYYLNLIAMEAGKFEIFDFAHNSAYADVAPQFYENEKLMFSSSRDTLTYKTLDWNKQPFLDLYYINAETVEKLEEEINSKFHEASAVYTKNLDTLYFSRNNLKVNNKNGTEPLKLYRAIRKNGKWKKITKLPFNSNHYSVAHPALSPDGKKLYFASDMPGTLGKLDLFVVDILPNNQYSTPKNLGDKINSVARETYPFISKNGKLYFASDGHFGLGGLDIFVSNKKKNKYTEPYNLSRPINSPYDDFSFIINSDTKKGYFASNRPGGVGQSDIYECRQKKDLIIDCNQHISGKTIESESKKEIPIAAIKVFDNNSNHIKTIFSDEQGNFEFNIDCSATYQLKIEKDQYEPKEEVIFADNTFDKEINLSIKLKKKIRLEKSWVLAGDDLNNILGLSKIYFDSDKASLKTSSITELKKVIKTLKNNPTLKLNIKSYTDNKGTMKHNKILSEKRSLSAKKYIVENGNIDADRIKTEGHGKSNPTVDCGKDCSEKELELNRRSEFIIIE